MRKGAAGRRKGCGLKAGMPDLVIFHNSRTIGVELKIPGAKPTPIQLEMFNKLRCAGVPVAIIHSIEELHEMLISLNIPMRKFSNGKKIHEAPESRRPQESPQGAAAP